MLLSAQNRIIRDYKYLIEHPIPNIIVCSTDDIKCFLLSFKQPDINKIDNTNDTQSLSEPEPEPEIETQSDYTDIIFHGKILFPNDYPSNPPRINLHV